MKARKNKPTESFSVRHELEKFAAQLGGDGWKTKLPCEFTPFEALAHSRSAAEVDRGNQVALQEQFDWIMLLGCSGTIMVEKYETDEGIWFVRNGVLLIEAPKAQPVPADWDPGDDEPWP